MVRAVASPGCCSSVILLDFGHSTTSQFGRRTPTKEMLADEISRIMAMYPSHGFLQATTTTEQQLPNEVLKELGWKQHLESKKRKHSENRLCLWTYEPLDQEKESIKPVVNPFAVKAPPVTASGGARLGETLVMTSGFSGTRTSRSAPFAEDPENFALQERAPTMGRHISDYLRPPRGVWINAQGLREVPEILRGVYISTRVAGNPNRTSTSRIAELWSWNLDMQSPNRITQIFIHPY